MSRPIRELREAHRRRQADLLRGFCVGLAVVFVTIMLASCTRPPNPGPCPPVVEYSDEFTEQFAAQLATIPEGSPVAVFILDARTLRKQVRQCQ